VCASHGGGPFYERVVQRRKTCWCRPVDSPEQRAHTRADFGHQERRRAPEFVPLCVEPVGNDGGEQWSDFNARDEVASAAPGLSLPGIEAVFGVV